GPLPRDYWRAMAFIGEPGTAISCLVSLSGRLEVHARGMRAEVGRICAIGLNERLGGDELVALREIGDRFGAAVVDESELPRIATEYGAPLSASMRPYSPPPPSPSCGLDELLVDFGPRPHPRRSLWEHAPVWANVAAGATN